ncbi:hypothetical protein HJFPF1_12752 [Paramyrothecium foliicola]|nr:hypothetical protein HJFPF1_12752 [Paramyrothecium foliicola]
MATPPPMVTPKRKRGEDTILAPISFSFDLSRNIPSEDGGNSPSSKVTHKFCGLALEGGVVPGEDHGDIAESMSKRQKQDAMMQDAPEIPRSLPDDPEDSVPATIPQPDVPAIATEGLQRSYPSINRLSESKSRARKRAGTPPLRFKSTPVPNETQDDSDDDGDDEMEIIDPVRAALTWHEDEITVYDPDDEDDDGIGINGIGFKPTPALAHARSLKRRQQMAEYRKREDSDARAKRNQRRRGASSIAFGPGEKSPPRKVRFTEAEHQNIAVTMG